MSSQKYNTQNVVSHCNMQENKVIVLLGFLIFHISLTVMYQTIYTSWGETINTQQPEGLAQQVHSGITYSCLSPLHPLFNQLIHIHWLTVYLHWNRNHSWETVWWLSFCSTLLCAWPTVWMFSVSWIFSSVGMALVIIDGVNSNKKVGLDG